MSYTSSPSSPNDPSRPHTIDIGVGDGSHPIGWMEEKSNFDANAGAASSPSITPHAPTTHDDRNRIATTSTNSFQIKVILADDTHRMIEAESDWTLERLRDAVYPQAAASEQTGRRPPKIDIIYMGQRLSSHALLGRTLAQLRIRPNTSIHILLRSAASTAHSSFQNSDEKDDREEQLVPDSEYGGYYFDDPIDRDGNIFEFIIGVIIGGVLGIIALILFLQPTLSRLCRTGIMVGITLNIIFGLSQWILLTPGVTPIGETSGAYGIKEPLQPSQIYGDQAHPPVVIGPTRHG